MYIATQCYCTDDYVDAPSFVVVEVDEDYVKSLIWKQQRMSDIEGICSAEFYDDRAMFIHYPDVFVDASALELFDNLTDFGTLESIDGLVEYDRCEYKRVKIYESIGLGVSYTAWLDDTDVMFYSDTIDPIKILKLLEERRDGSL